ncbi:hypothetical protein [Actinophytocola sp.]|uniref:hypothetical protein n=1 Tax=Actinophytocola sp. TaxID=1872138 RepID=UPI003D6B9D39
MAAVSAESTELFVGTVDAPLQVVRVSFTGSGSARVHVEGAGVDTPEPVDLAVTGQAGVEVAVDTHGAAPGTTLPTRAVVARGADRFEVDFELVVAEPGWTMHMVSHFHYDPVWWNTQAAYTIAWDELDFQARTAAPAGSPGSTSSARTSISRSPSPSTLPSSGRRPGWPGRRHWHSTPCETYACLGQVIVSRETRHL